MLEFNVRGRGSGKTSEIINTMYADENMICIVRNYEMKRYYPKDLHDRVIAVSTVVTDWPQAEMMFKRQSRNLPVVMNGRGSGKSFVPYRRPYCRIDEGISVGCDLDMLRLYYTLGELGVDIVSYGSLDSQEKHTL